MNEHYSKPKHSFVVGQRVKNKDGCEATILAANPFSSQLKIEFHTGVRQGMRPLIVRAEELTPV